MAKPVKINVIFDRAVPTSSTSPQELYLVMTSVMYLSWIQIKRPQRSWLNLKKVLSLLFVSLVVNKSTEAILLAKMLESTVKSTYYNF